MPTIALAEDVDPITKLINHVSQEHIKTRTENTKYADAKFTQYEEKIQTEIKPFIDENFKILDDRLHALATQVIFQLSLSIFFAILLANATWYMIKRAIERIRKPRFNQKFKDTLTQNNYGIIPPEYKEKMKAEDQTIIKKPELIEKEITPTSPNMNQIETMLEKKHEQERKGEQ
jgi:uncharacterized protein YwqG